MQSKSSKVIYSPIGVGVGVGVGIGIGIGIGIGKINRGRGKSKADYRSSMGSNTKRPVSECFGIPAILRGKLSRNEPGHWSKEMLTMALLLAIMQLGSKV